MLSEVKVSSARDAPELLNAEGEFEHDVRCAL